MEELKILDREVGSDASLRRGVHDLNLIVYSLLECGCIILCLAALLC